ncbi:MAG: metallophosphoesterase [Clostridia bacterium]|nr:metallophosphoesterase [Clostridia bacterium]
MKKNLYIFHFILVGLLPFCAILTASLFWQAFCALSVFHEILYAVLAIVQMFFVSYLGILFKCKKAPDKAQLCFSAFVAAGLPFAFFAALFVFVRVIPVGSMIACILAAAIAAVYYLVFYVRTLLRFVRSYPFPNGICSAAIALLSTGAILLVFLLTPLLFEGNRVKDAIDGAPSTDTWSSEDVYDLANTAVLEKDPNKDFVILNLTDVQLCDYDFNPLLGTAKDTFALIDEMVRRTNPDLITVSGDISCGYEFSAKQITSFLDSFEIPWAPVFGNHDHEIHNATALYTADIFMQGKYCLFQKGAASLGIGNYIVNVKEGDRVVQSILLMDSHNEAEYEVNGKLKQGYAHFWEEQVAWYKWAVDGVQAYGAGEVVKSTVIAHIPLPAFADAYAEAIDDEKTKDYQNGSWKTEDAFGAMKESAVNSGIEDPYGFFEAMVQAGSTEHYIAGHDHKNNFSVVYRGIRLTYALNTGAGCYYSPRFNGATTLTVNEQGSVDIVHHYLDN